MNWSEWKDIEKKSDYKECGIYKIRLSDLNKKPIEIHRFLNNDREGILLIGRTTNIDRRIGYFYGAMKGKRYAHLEGKRLHRIIIDTCFPKKFKVCKIQYSFKQLQTEDMTKIEEKQLMNLYFCKYGEVPPLNNNLP